jgi:tetratricopeptide (TPR) repeat protein
MSDGLVESPRTFSWDTAKDPTASDAVQSIPTPSRYLQLREEASAAAAAAALAERTDERRLARCLIALSDCHERLADLQQARATASRALAHAEMTGDQQAAADAQLREARLHCRLGDPVAGEEVLEAGLALIEADSDIAMSTFLLTSLATVHLSGGQISSALALLDRAFTLARAAGCTSGKGHALTAVGVVYTTQGDFGRAREILARASLLHQRAGDLDALGRTYNNIGVAYHRDEGNFVQAIPFLELGLEFTAVRADLLVVINSLSNNVRAYEDLHGEAAMQFRPHMASLINELPDPEMGRLSDQTLRAIEMVTTPGSAQYSRDPFIAEPVAFAPMPSGIASTVTEVTSPTALA